MHAEIGAVRAELLGGDREVDRLQQRVGGRARLRLRRGRPVAEGEEADLFHATRPVHCSPYFVARAIGFNHNLDATQCQWRRPLTVSRRYPSACKAPGLFSEPADIEPDLPRSLLGQINQGKAMCRKLHPLDGLFLKSSRSFNSIKSVELNAPIRLQGAAGMSKKLVVGYVGQPDPSVEDQGIRRPHRRSRWRACSAQPRPTFDIEDLGPSFAQARRLGDLDPAARNIVDQLSGADVLVVGSPTFKGSYTGLFKHFFDLLDPASLQGKPVILAATGGGERHSLIVEHQLAAAVRLLRGADHADRDLRLRQGFRRWRARLRSRSAPAPSRRWPRHAGWSAGPTASASPPEASQQLQLQSRARPDGRLAHASCQQARSQ